VDAIIRSMTEKFAGHDIETGFLQRLRSWRDVLPPLILFQSLRVCGSPIFLTLSLVSVIAISAIFGRGSVYSEIPAPSFTSPIQFEIAWIFWRQSVELIGAILIGMVPAAAIMRAGAIYAAGRDAEPTLAGLKVVWSRAVAMLLVLVLPIACILGLSVPVALLAIMDRIPSVGDWITELLGLLVVPLAILIGMIGAGAIVAIPIGWASLSIEKRSDPFDALSRGYEYLYRRPVQLAVYFTTSILVATFLCWMAQWVAFVGSLLGSLAYSLGSGGEPLPLAIRVVLAHLPIAVWMTSFFAVLGGIYLLLRKDANEQEIEDIVLSAVDRNSAELPTLPTKQ